MDRRVRRRRLVAGALALLGVVAAVVAILTAEGGTTVPAPDRLGCPPTPAR